MDTVVSIPYYVHEGVVARMDRCNRRLLGALIVAVTALIIETVIIKERHDEEDD